MTPRTHLAIDAALCGRPATLAEGAATVILDTLPAMAADDRGLVHGGFVFGAADYAAMLAANDPNVVLGAADARFLAPVRVGEQVRCVATREGEGGRKQRILVTAAVGERAVFQGTFTVFVLDHHVLDR